jgi:hypothetical protein
MGEVVRAFEASPDGRWWRIENHADRYSGWVRSWGLVGASATRAAGFERRAVMVVKAYAEVRSLDGRTLVSPVVWRNRLLVGRARGPVRSAELPDGRRGWIAVEAVARASVARTSLSERIRDLLGVPYLWGGRTPLGIDCSAFTQLVLAEQGIALPRDAQDQHRACKPVALDEVRPADLLFFGRPRGPLGHVALALGGGAYAHARGWVRVNSLNRGNPLYDSELAHQLRAAGRPVGPTSGRRRRAPRTAEVA